MLSVYEHIFRFSFEVKAYKAFPKVIIIGKHMMIEFQYVCLCKYTNRRWDIFIWNKVIT